MMKKALPIPYFHAVLGLALALIVGTPSTPAAAADLEAFVALRDAVRHDQSVSEEKVMEMVEMAAEVDRPFQAHLAVRQYLNRNPRPSSELMRVAAESARRAGDFRTSIARYKSYLELADYDAEASEAAAELYRMLIGVLREPDDAYVFMRKRGTELRQSAAARRFDGWFLAEARDRGHVAAHARHLAAVMGDPMPLEAEKLHFGSELDWLTRRLSEARRSDFEALPHARAMVERIRKDEHRRNLLRLVAGHLEFYIQAAGQDEAGKAKAFEKVIDLAEQVVEARPTASGLQEVLAVFAGGLGRFDAGRWKDQQELKQAFFAQAFEALEDDEARRKVLAWRHDDEVMAPRLASAETWAEIGARHAGWLTDHPGLVARIPLVTRAEDRAIFTRQAKFLEGVRTAEAALVRALAASPDPVKIAAHLFKEEAWHLGPSEAFKLLNGPVREAVRALDENAASDDPWHQAMARIGRAHVAGSVWALFAPEAARHYLLGAWESAGDKARIADDLARLAWVPWTEKEREQAIGAARQSFRAWTESLREAEGDHEAELSKVSGIQSAFNQLENSTGDLEKAPDAVARHAARARAAVAEKSLETFNEAARDLDAALRKGGAHKPFEEALLRYMLANRRETFDTIDLQAEIFGRELADWPERERTIRLAAETIMGGGWDRHWGWFEVHRKFQDRARKINRVLETALLEQLEAGEFWPATFHWLRGVRHGRGWRAWGWNENVLSKMIEDETFVEHDARVAHEFAATSYQWLIRHRFSGLDDKYPREHYFDDMFVAEANRKKDLDDAYWRYGRDKDGKIANVAARLLAEFDRIPFGRQDKMIGRPAEFLRWHGRALRAEPSVRKPFLESLEAAYGKSRFDAWAMGRAWLQAPGRKADAAWFKKLSQYVQRAREAGALHAPPSLDPLEDVEAEALSDEALDTLRAFFGDLAPLRYPDGDHLDRAAELLHKGLLARDREVAIYAMVPYFWQLARDTDDSSLQRRLAGFAKEMQEAEKHGLATVYATSGLEMIGSDLPSDIRIVLTNVRSRSLLASGGAIPVPRSDPRYPMFEAQAAYLSGQYDMAWERYLDRRGMVSNMIDDLDPAFLVWLVRKNTEVRSFEAAETLGQQIITWMDKQDRSFEPEVRASVLLAYAEISLERQEYPRARAQFQRIAASEDFKETEAGKQAMLMIAEIHRRTGEYEEAINELEDLLQKPDRYLQIEGNYMFARVRFDQEDYSAAAEHLEKVFALRPTHSDARLLKGKVDIRSKRYDTATELAIGPQTDRKVIIPGQSLRVSLQDPNLQVAGKASDVEIRAWTDAGDEEFFNLFPNDQNRTHFEGSIETKLAPATAKDHVLQVRGGDTVYYTFSPRFAEQQNLADRIEEVTSTMEVRSPAELYVSSGEILGKEEMAERRMEEQIRRRLEIENRGGSGMQMALSTRRDFNQVKPGNPINVRVVAPDQSVSDERDTVYVAVKATSGRSLDRFPLEEVEPYTGIFEGAIPTASAGATAYASDSDEGRNPNYAIAEGDFPPWVALTDGRRPKIFSVDLNDNVALGRLSVLANVPGRKITSFEVQTSLNGTHFTTVGSWPETHTPWGGAPIVDLVKLTESQPENYADFREYFENTAVQRGLNIARERLETVAAEWGNNPAGKAKALGLGGGDAYLARFQAAFYMDERRMRRFEIKPEGLGQEDKFPRYTLAINGETGSNPHVIQRSLPRGVHVIEVLVATDRRHGPNFELHCDVPEPPYIAACPPAMFSPEEHPEIRDEIYKEPAQIAAEEEATQFHIDFDFGTRARVVRLLIKDFETDAPAIRSVALTSAKGETILPTDESPLARQDNMELDIVPGDQISVSYEDPTPIREADTVQEAFLTATYHDAELSAAFVEYTQGRDGRQATYIPMRRFNPGDTINVFINDPDEDVSPEQDTVDFTASVFGSEPRRMRALETGQHTGVFLGTVFPVEGEPERDAEIQVQSGDDVSLSYMDQVNTDPGIPWQRTAVVEQVWYTEPQVRPYEVTSIELEEVPEKEDQQQQRQAPAASEEQALNEYVPPTRSLVATRPDEIPEEPVQILHRGPLLVEIIHPTITLAPTSQAEIFVQTRSAREAHRQARAEAQPRENGAREGRSGGERPGPGPGGPQGGPGPEGPEGQQGPGAPRPDASPGSGPGAGAPSQASQGGPGGPGESEAGQDVPFDLSVPGTQRFTRIPGDAGAGNPPPGYRDVVQRGKRGEMDPLDEGRFTFNIPFALGSVPDESLVEKKWGRDEQRPPMHVSGEDALYVGYRYENEAGKTKWVVHEIEIETDPFFHVMDRAYEALVDALRVGEKFYVRVIDPAMGTSDENDRITLDITTESGHQKSYEAVETYSHSGIFKGIVQLVYEEDASAVERPGTLPVRYGDKVTVSYAPSGREPMTREVDIYVGSDGEIMPFTKQYEDPETAVQTQFTIAEAFFEQAKQHRKLGDDSLARRQIAQGRRLLKEAIRDFPDTPLQAQADYLLAELAYEFGKDAENMEIKRRQFLEAVTRFNDIVALYPDSPYAPRSQYKKALVLEKMAETEIDPGAIDRAMEEYVKLSYRYPDNELVAETIARLGQYFLDKGKEYEAEIEELTDPVERERVRMEAREMYTVAGDVFGRLSERFPDHELSTRTLVLSGQSYLRGEAYEKAVASFEKVYQVSNPDPEMAPVALYWAGDAQYKARDMLEAYRTFKKLTWDYPEGRWAKYARGRLTEEAMIKAAESDNRE